VANRTLSYVDNRLFLTLVRFCSIVFLNKDWIVLWEIETEYEITEKGSKPFSPYIEKEILR